MIEAKENFNNTWPFNPNFFSGNGFKQHYVDEGKENNKVILCLHGEPTWGYIYRHFIKELSKNFKSKIKLNYKYDQSLIGGLVVQVGSTMIDTSIKNKLQLIENRMIEA